jgi:hypothetical protein
VTLYDPQAEQTIAACAAHNSTAALACTDRLRAEHFHDPRCWWIVQASLTVPDELPDGADPRDGWWREHTVAMAANVWPAVLQEWCQQARHAWDIDGRVADRVIAAHQARQHAQRLLDELEDLGVGVEWKAA